MHISPSQGSDIDQINLSDAAVNFDVRPVIYSDDSDFFLIARRSFMLIIFSF